MVCEYLSGFLNLVSLKAKASKTLLGAIKPTNPSVRITYKGQISFGKPELIVRSYSFVILIASNVTRRTTIKSRLYSL